MLKDIVKPGDWILLEPNKAGIGKLISKVTFSPYNHAAIVIDSETLFETDGDLFKAKFTKLDKYEGREVTIIRSKTMQEHLPELMAECKKYENKPYDYPAILLNGIFFGLTPPIRRKILNFFNIDKRQMYCSELTARITYDLTGRKELREFGGLTPEDLHQIAHEHPEEYTFVQDSEQ